MTLFDEPTEPAIPTGVWWHDLHGADPLQPLQIHAKLQKLLDEEPECPCFYFVQGKRHVYLTADEAVTSLKRCKLPVGQVSEPPPGTIALNHEKCLEEDPK